jgi:hypothetical protein
MADKDGGQDSRASNELNLIFIELPEHCPIKINRLGANVAEGTHAADPLCPNLRKTDTRLGMSYLGLRRPLSLHFSSQHRTRRSLLGTDAAPLQRSSLTAPDEIICCEIGSGSTQGRADFGDGTTGIVITRRTPVPVVNVSCLLPELHFNPREVRVMK